MPDYQQLYVLLFNAATDAVAAISEMDFGTAKARLVTAQQQAEEQYTREKDAREESG